MIENERVFTAHVSSIKTFYSGYILGRVKLKGTNYLSSIFYSGASDTAVIWYS